MSKQTPTDENNRECVNCTAPATDRYTLDLPASETLLKERPLCDECLQDFQEADWIEVRAT